MRKQPENAYRPAEKKHTWIKIGNSKHQCCTCGVIRRKLNNSEHYYEFTLNGKTTNENPECTKSNF